MERIFLLVKVFQWHRQNETDPCQTRPSHSLRGPQKAHEEKSSPSGVSRRKSETRPWYSVSLHVKKRIMSYFTVCKLRSTYFHLQSAFLQEALKHASDDLRQQTAAKLHLATRTFCRSSRFWSLPDRNQWSVTPAIFQPKVKKTGPQLNWDQKLKNLLDRALVRPTVMGRASDSLLGKHP